MRIRERGDESPPRKIDLLETVVHRHRDLRLRPDRDDPPSHTCNSLAERPTPRRRVYLASRKQVSAHNGPSQPSTADYVFHQPILFSCSTGREESNRSYRSKKGADARKGGCNVSISKILVVGAGQMGAGIAQVTAQAGIDATLADISLDHAQRGLGRVSKALSRLVDKGRMAAEQKDSILSRITAAPDLEAAAAGADLVIEAIAEDPAAKSDLWGRLADICTPEVIFASNTSSISITSMARDSRRPDRFIGMHFMNPVPLMQLVEVVRGLETSDSVCDAIVELARKMGKEPVVVSDSAAFVVNRIAIPMINEAAFTLMEGISTAEGIDTCAKLGLNHPLGPLALADLIGLDTVVSILEVMVAETGDPKYRPCPLLRRMVAAGRLGRKAGQGFYKY